MFMKKLITRIKSNRTAELSEKDKKKCQFTKVSKPALKDGQSIKILMKGLDFVLQLIKKISINEDGLIGTLYLVPNYLNSSANYLYAIYQKQWNIEAYHKSIKQNVPLAKSPTKRLVSQSIYIFSSLDAFCKLKLLKIQTTTNHFPLKFELLVQANQIAFLELNNLRKSFSAQGK